LALQAHAADHAVEQLPGAADERAAAEVLAFAGAFADEEDLRVGVALAEYRIRARLVQAAARAAFDFVGVELLEADDLLLARQERRRERRRLHEQRFDLRGGGGDRGSGSRTRSGQWRRRRHVVDFLLGLRPLRLRWRRQRLRCSIRLIRLLVLLLESC